MLFLVIRHCPQTTRWHCLLDPITFCATSVARSYSAAVSSSEQSASAKTHLGRGRGRARSSESLPLSSSSSISSFLSSATSSSTPLLDSEEQSPAPQSNSTNDSFRHQSKPYKSKSFVSYSNWVSTDYKSPKLDADGISLSDDDELRTLLIDKAQELSSEAREAIVHFRREVWKESQHQHLTRNLTASAFFYGHVLDCLELLRGGFIARSTGELHQSSLISSAYADEKRFLEEVEAELTADERAEREYQERERQRNLFLPKPIRRTMRKVQKEAKEIEAKERRRRERLQNFNLLSYKDDDKSPYAHEDDPLIRRLEPKSGDSQEEHEKIQAGNSLVHRDPISQAIAADEAADEATQRTLRMLRNAKKMREIKRHLRRLAHQLEASSRSKAAELAQSPGVYVDIGSGAGVPGLLTLLMMRDIDAKPWYHPIQSPIRRLRGERYHQLIPGLPATVVTSLRELDPEMKLLKENNLNHVAKLLLPLDEAGQPLFPTSPNAAPNLPLMSSTSSVPHLPSPPSPSLSSSSSSSSSPPSLSLSLSTTPSSSSSSSITSITDKSSSGKISSTVQKLLEKEKIEKPSYPVAVVPPGIASRIQRRSMSKNQKDNENGEHDQEMIVDRDEDEEYAIDIWTPEYLEKKREELAVRLKNAEANFVTWAAAAPPQIYMPAPNTMRYRPVVNLTHSIERKADEAIAKNEPINWVLTESDSNKAHYLYRTVKTLGLQDRVSVFEGDIEEWMNQNERQLQDAHEPIQAIEKLEEARRMREPHFVIPQAAKPSPVLKKKQEEQVIEALLFSPLQPQIAAPEKSEDSTLISSSSSSSLSSSSMLINAATSASSTSIPISAYATVATLIANQQSSAVSGYNNNREATMMASMNEVERGRFVLRKLSEREQIVASLKKIRSASVPVAIVARAVSSIDEIYSWLRPFKNWSTLILIKGPDWDLEWAHFQKRNKLLARELRIMAERRYTAPIGKEDPVTGNPADVDRIIVRIERFKRVNKLRFYGKT